MNIFSPKETADHFHTKMEVARRLHLKGHTVEIEYPITGGKEGPVYDVWDCETNVAYEVGKHTNADKELFNAREKVSIPTLRPSQYDEIDNYLILNGGHERDVRGEIVQMLEMYGFTRGKRLKKRKSYTWTYKYKGDHLIVQYTPTMKTPRFIESNNPGLLDDIKEIIKKLEAGT